ncbi:MAG TPA: SET domain-containing protein [Candidatus Paceibacterota bacterium]
MKDSTDEFSFIAKPSIHGIGIFAAHGVKKDTFMRIFGKENPRRLLDKKDVPEIFLNYCADRGDKVICPPDFGYMPIGWYMNHSNTPNTEPRGEYSKETGYSFYTIRDINEGEEITINYNSLEESEGSKEDYYKS